MSVKDRAFRLEVAAKIEKSGKLTEQALPGVLRALAEKLQEGYPGHLIQMHPQPEARYPHQTPAYWAEVYIGQVMSNFDRHSMSQAMVKAALDAVLAG